MDINKITPLIKQITKGRIEPSRGWDLEETCAACFYWALAHKAWKNGQKFNKAKTIRELQQGPLAHRSRGSIEAKTMNVTSAAQILVAKGVSIYTDGEYVKRGTNIKLGPKVLQGYAPAPNRAKLIDELLPQVLSVLGLISTMDIEKAVA